MNGQKLAVVFNRYSVLLAILVLVVMVLYWPGLHSFFLFDDFNNLNALIHIPDNSIFVPEVQEFVLSGEAGRLGRPLSLLTFAFQADAWPSNPFPFKLFNLLLHAINTVLVYWLCIQLCHRLKLRATAIFFIATFSTSLWAIHPLHITAVLYVVQRMTLLSGFFMLVGMLCYMHYRPLVDSMSGGKYFTPLTCTLVFAGMLGLFSKENAGCLLLYIIALEYTLFSKDLITSRVRLWRIAILWLPFTALVMLSLIYAMANVGRYPTMVGFTLIERVLTESRVLWLYLAQVLNPDIGAARLFYTPSISTSLLSPVTTFFACIAWLVAIVVALRCRRQHPIFALGVFWYLAGHSIESTFIPLELYFNHRNYLPILGPILVFMYLVNYLTIQTKYSLRSVYWAVPALIILIAGFQTSYNARLWRHPLNLAADWYTNDPSELRNAEFYAIEISRTGQAGVQQASQIYDDILNRYPENLRPLFNRMLMTCISGSVSLPPQSVIITHANRSKPEEKDLDTPINELVNQALAGNCPGVPLSYLESTLQTVLIHLNEDVQAQTLFALARIRVRLGDNLSAIDLYDQAFSISEDPGVLFAKALLQLQMDDAESALETIAAARELVLVKNNIVTGTAESKLAMLDELRNSAKQMLEGTDQPSGIN